jgi:hypothetical protein
MDDLYFMYCLSKTAVNTEEKQNGATLAFSRVFILTNTIHHAHVLILSYDI